jgi:multicomponent Na+:H+ antiporter subunit E
MLSQILSQTLTYVLLPIPLAVVWMLLTARVELGSFAVGFLLGLAVLVLTNAHRPRLSWRLVRQGGALIVYTLELYRDILLSGLDLTRRLLSPDMKLRTGIIAVPTQEKSCIVAALSAHAITITPGELVVEFDGDDVLYVHCLDVDAAEVHERKMQTHRRELIDEIIGVSHE